MTASGLASHLSAEVAWHAEWSERYLRLGVSEQMVSEYIALPCGRSVDRLDTFFEKHDVAVVESWVVVS